MSRLTLRRCLVRPFDMLRVPRQVEGQARHPERSRRAPLGDGWSEHGGAVRRDRTREIAYRDQTYLRLGVIPTAVSKKFGVLLTNFAEWVNTVN